MNKWLSIIIAACVLSLGLSGMSGAGPGFKPAQHDPNLGGNGGSALAQSVAAAQGLRGGLEGGVNIHRATSMAEKLQKTTGAPEVTKGIPANPQVLDIQTHIPQEVRPTQGQVAPDLNRYKDPAALPVTGTTSRFVQGNTSVSNRVPYVPIDVPGHRDYVKHMITGAASIDPPKDTRLDRYIRNSRLSFQVTVGVADACITDCFFAPYRGLGRSSEYSTTGAVDKPFLMPIEDVFSLGGRGTVVTGRQDGKKSGAQQAEPTVKTYKYYYADGGRVEETYTYEGERQTRFNRSGYRPDGSLASSWTIDYHADGTKTQVVTYIKPDGSFTETTTKFDKKGKLIEGEKKAYDKETGKTETEKYNKKTGKWEKQ